MLPGEEVELPAMPGAGRDFALALPVVLQLVDRGRDRPRELPLRDRAARVDTVVRDGGEYPFILNTAISRPPVSTMSPSPGGEFVRRADCLGRHRRPNTSVAVSPKTFESASSRNRFRIIR